MPTGFLREDRFLSDRVEVVTKPFSREYSTEKEDLIQACNSCMACYMVHAPCVVCDSVLDQCVLCDSVRNLCVVCDSVLDLCVMCDSVLGLCVVY